MKLYMDNGFGVWEERAVPPTGEIPFRAEGEALLLDTPEGTRRFALRNGEARIPRGAFCPGENRMRLVTDTGIFPVEGILREKDVLRPAGFDPCPAILRLLRRADELGKEIAALASRLSAAEERVHGFTLFGESADTTKGEKR